MRIRFELAGFHRCLLPARTPGTRTGIAAQKDLLEGLPKHLVKYGVENGVYHGTGVAQPGDHIEYPVADSLLALRTHGGQEVQDEEGGP